MKFYPQYSFSVGWECLIPLTSLYLFGVYFLKASRANQSQTQVQIQGISTFMAIYNISQILLSTYMFFGLSKSFAWNNIFGLNRVPSPEIEYYMLVHYLSKIFDWCDTLFIILKQNWRQLTFLHVYHHFSIVLIWGFLLQVGHANGTSYFGAFINSGVHALMYSHYFYTSLGYKNPYKTYLTQIQIFQFVLCLMHAVFGLLYETILPKFYCWLQFVYQIIMLVLFVNFHLKNINQKSE